MSWTLARAAAVAAGGALGAAVRWAIVTAVANGGAFPWSVLVVNLAGSFVLGALLAEEWSHPSRRLLIHDFGGIGFCGGLTTFSTFAVEAVDLTRGGHAGTALVYGVASIAGTLACVVAGAAAFRRVRALTLPLEEQP
jgi:CrcB protein